MTYEKVSKRVADSLLALFSGELARSYFCFSRESNSLQQCPPASLHVKCISQHGMGLKISLRREDRDRVWGACVCVVFGGAKLLFVFFCLYRINSVTSLPLLSQDPAHLVTEDLNTLAQGCNIDCP